MSELEEKITCTFHPNIETSLRCSRCNRPICAKCAKRSPTGYQCVDCIRGHQRKFETANWYDYPLAIILAMALSFFGSYIASFLGFFTIFVAPIAGTIIAEVIRAVLRRRRSKLLFQSVAIATALGGLPLVISLLLNRGFGSLFSLLWLGVYVFLATSTVYYRLSGIRVRY